MLIIAYEYETACGAIMRKAVICKDAEEYRKIKQRIEDAAGFKLIEFDEVYKAYTVL